MYTWLEHLKEKKRKTKRKKRGGGEKRRAVSAELTVITTTNGLVEGGQLLRRQRIDAAIADILYLERRKLVTCRGQAGSSTYNIYCNGSKEGGEGWCRHFLCCEEITPILASLFDLFV